MLRPVLGVVAGLATAALGAYLVGENLFVRQHEVYWPATLVGVVLFGVMVAEVVATVGRSRSPVLLAGVAALTAAGLALGVWISSGRDLAEVDPLVWAGVGLGVAAAVVWFRSAGQRGGRTPDRTARTPDE